MNNNYTAILASAAILLAGTSQAQLAAHSKTGAQASRISLINPSASAQHGTAGEWRGGPPPNDNCSAVTIDALASGSTLNYTGTTVGATNTGDAEPGSGLDLGGDTVFVFHAFTTTGCNDISIAYCGTDPQPAIYQAVLSTTCPMGEDLINFSSGEFTSCSDGNATINWVAVPAGTYYVPVRGEPATAGAYALAITATACPSAPANDECEAATVLAPGTNCVGTPFTTTGATQTLEPILCADFTSENALDVFFSFQATATTMTIGVIGFNAADAMVELLEGTCGSLSSLACADATFPGTADETTSEELIQSGLAIGTTYFVRVYDWGHNSADHNFEICVVEGEGSGIGMDENAVSEFSIFPNPGTGVFNLQYAGKNGLANIEVLDVTGRIVYNKQAQVANGSTNSMDLTGLGAGNYNVRLTVGGVRTEQRLMVK